MNAREEEFERRMRERAARPLPPDIAEKWNGEERRNGYDRRQSEEGGFFVFGLGYLMGMAMATIAALVGHYLM